MISIVNFKRVLYFVQNHCQSPVFSIFVNPENHKAKLSETRLVSSCKQKQTNGLLMKKIFLKEISSCISTRSYIVMEFLCFFFKLLYAVPIPTPQTVCGSKYWMYFTVMYLPVKWFADWNILRPAAFESPIVLPEVETEKLQAKASRITSSSQWSFLETNYCFTYPQASCRQPVRGETIQFYALGFLPNFWTP